MDLISMVFSQRFPVFAGVAAAAIDHEISSQRGMQENLSAFLNQGLSG